MATWQQLWILVRVAFRHRLDLLLPVAEIEKRRVRWPLQIMRRLLREPEQPRGDRLRNALIELGPVYIKFGQLLSTRRDLFPPDVIDSLTTLQDRVPPIVDFDVNHFVQEQLGDDHGLITAIEPLPLASASIAQVHTARLTTGEEVVLKLVRPGIEATIREDMQLLRACADRVNDWSSEIARLHLPQVTRDHEYVLLQELNMFAEARNQIQLRRNFAESDLLYVPRVYAHLTRQNLLVMERVYGVPINQIEELNRRGVDLRVLAHKGVETFFTQVFEHNFFHADMHPGNILIDTTAPENPKYIALDCAIIGSLTSDDQRYLAQNLIAFFNRDYRGVVDLHLASGWIPADTDADEFERVIREVCDPIFAKPLAEISFADFAITLFQTAGHFNMEVQPQLVLLQKTLLYVEGLGRQLYPQLDLWETAQPFMERWAQARLGPAALLREWLAAGPTVWQNLVRLPTYATQVDKELQALKSHLSQQGKAIARIESSLNRTQQWRRAKQVAGSAVLGFSIWLMWQPLSSALHGGDVTVVAGIIGAFAGSALLLRA